MIILKVDPEEQKIVVDKLTNNDRAVLLACMTCGRINIKEEGIWEGVVEDLIELPFKHTIGIRKTTAEVLCEGLENLTTQLNEPFSKYESNPEYLGKESIWLMRKLTVIMHEDLKHAITQILGWEE